jgi:hypothetical protein
VLTASLLALALSLGQSEAQPRVIEVPMPPAEQPAPGQQPQPAPQPVPQPEPIPIPLPVPDAGSPSPDDRGAPLPPPNVFLAPDAGSPPIGPLQPAPKEDTGVHFYGALELDFTSEPSGPLGGANDALFGIKPIAAFDAGEWFEAELGAYFRLRLFDDPPENRSTDIGGVLRGADWDQASDFGQIIRRLRIAKEDGPFHVKVGMATRRTLGLGHLINRYSNQENPDYHPAALSAVLNIGPTRTEGFISDVFGARIYAGEFSFDFGRLTDNPEQYDRWLFSVSGAGDAGLAGYTAPGATLMHSDFAAVIYKSPAARILLETGFGARFDVRSDFGFVTGIAVDADLGTLQAGGKFEVRKQYGGFRHGFFGPNYEISRFASYGFSGPPQALEQLPDNWSLYGELRIASGKIVSTDASFEHFFYGRTDLDFSLALDLWEGRITALSRLGVVGIGIDPRFNTRTELRVRFLSFMYALAHAGILLSPQPDWSLGRGFYLGIGVGADFRR